MQRPLLFFVFLAVAGTSASICCGEVFLLKSGGRIEGEVLNPQRERGQPWQVKTEKGVRLALADSSVSRVIVKTDWDRQYEALAAKLENTALAHWELAEWCKEAGLSEQRKRHLQAVIGIDPNHEEARRALGYQRFGSRWLTQEEHQLSQGYVKYKGTWRTKQEVEIATRGEQYELAVKKFRKDIRLWLDQEATGGRLSGTATQNLNALNDPAAVPALAEVVADAQQSLGVRKRSLDILKRLPARGAALLLTNVALQEKNPGIQETCMELLKEQAPDRARDRLLQELKNKDNARLNRAADCLGQLGDKSVTLALINVLVTEHRETIQVGSPGGLSPGFSGNGSGSFSAGAKKMTVTKTLQNQSVRDALIALYPGENHNFDVEAWRTWYIKTQTTSDVNLRRDD